MLSKDNPQVGKAVAEYLRATDHVYELCMAKSVSPDYHDAWEKFRRTFFVLKKMISLQETISLYYIRPKLAIKKFQISSAYVLTAY